MLKWAVVFLLIAIVVGIFGFSDVAAGGRRARRLGVGREIQLQLSSAGVSQLLAKMIGVRALRADRGARF